MGVNKVTLNTPNGEEVVVDFSNDTVTADALLSGYTAHGADGEPITGTLEAGSPVEKTEAPLKDVNFYDYDGTRLYSYTIAEAQALTALPPLPEHTGLVCQGWNWTLESIKAHNTLADIGATYVTDDGRTRIYVELEQVTLSPVLCLYINGTVEVDWGDGSEIETMTGTSEWGSPVYSQPHNYEKPGSYVISFKVTGSIRIKTPRNCSALLSHSSVATGWQGKHYRAVIKRCIAEQG